MIGIFFAEGFEEVEALTVVDLLRRSGIDNEMISITGKQEVTGSHKIEIKTDALIEDVDFDKLDGIVLPGGGPGYTNLEKCAYLCQKVTEFSKSGKLVAAICGAPSILGHLGILEGKRATIFPGMEEHLKGAKVLFDSVVCDQNIITSRGMGTSVDFGLALIEYLKDSQASQAMAHRIVYR